MRNGRKGKIQPLSAEAKLREESEIERRRGYIGRETKGPGKITDERDSQTGE